MWNSWNICGFAIDFRELKTYFVQYLEKKSREALLSQFTWNHDIWHRVIVKKLKENPCSSRDPLEPPQGSYSFSFLFTSTHPSDMDTQWEWVRERDDVRDKNKYGGGDKGCSQRDSESLIMSNQSSQVICVTEKHRKYTYTYKKSIFQNRVNFN